MKGKDGWPRNATTNRCWGKIREETLFRITRVIVRSIGSEMNEIESEEKEEEKEEEEEKDGEKFSIIVVCAASRIH